MSGKYTGYGDLIRDGQVIDSSLTKDCKRPNLDVAGVTFLQRPAHVYVSDDSHGNITVLFLQNTSTLSSTDLYPNQRVVHYKTTDQGDHAQDSVGNYYYEYATKSLRVHFSFPNNAGPCKLNDSRYSVVNSNSGYLYLSVGNWDFMGSKE